jgi:hypothetical protein
VGFRGINCLGELLSYPNPYPDDMPSGGRFEDEMQYDPSVISRLKALNIAKEQAMN